MTIKRIVDQPSFNPANDGTDHINVYTKGKTHLGRALCNPSDCNIEHPYFGHFRTLEGLWFYMKTGFVDDEFRLIKGLAAREKGKGMPSRHYGPFSKMFKLGMLEKLQRNPELQKELMENELPLAHYYVKGDGTPIPLSRHQWQLDFWTLMRSALVNTGSLDTIRTELVGEIDYMLERHAASTQEG
jgi:hypothetical protein